MSIELVFSIGILGVCDHMLDTLPIRRPVCRNASLTVTLVHDISKAYDSSEDSQRSRIVKFSMGMRKNNRIFEKKKKKILI